MVQVMDDSVDIWLKGVVRSRILGVPHSNMQSTLRTVNCYDCGEGNRFFKLYRSRRKQHLELMEKWFYWGCPVLRR